jgi:hypothetical protein
VIDRRAGGARKSCASGWGGDNRQKQAPSPPSIAGEKEVAVLKSVRTVLTTFAASAALAGCMTMGAQEKEGQLAAAGFVRQQADTPQKLAKLQALPQNTMVFSQRKRGNVYIYADAAGCNCAFIGNDAAYQQYQQIRTANNIAQMQETTAMLNQQAAMDWGGVWGPYAPGWY